MAELQFAVPNYLAGKRRTPGLNVLDMAGGFNPAALAASTGINFLSGALGSLAGGKSRRSFKQSRANLMDLADQEVFNPFLSAMMADRALLGQDERNAAQIARVSGNLSSADALGSLRERGRTSRYNFLADAVSRAAIEKARRKERIYSTLLSTDAGMYSQY